MPLSPKKINETTSESKDNPASEEIKPILPKSEEKGLSSQKNSNKNSIKRGIGSKRREKRVKREVGSEKTSSKNIQVGEKEISDKDIQVVDEKGNITINCKTDKK
jgi:hypothetical protein